MKGSGGRIIVSQPGEASCFEVACVSSGGPPSSAAPAAGGAEDEPLKLQVMIGNCPDRLACGANATRTVTVDCPEGARRSEEQQKR